MEKGLGRASGLEALSSGEVKEPLNMVEARKGKVLRGSSDRWRLLSAVCGRTGSSGEEVEEVTTTTTKNRQSGRDRLRSRNGQTVDVVQLARGAGAGAGVGGGDFGCEKG